MSARHGFASAASATALLLPLVTACGGDDLVRVPQRRFADSGDGAGAAGRRAATLLDDTRYVLAEVTATGPVEIPRAAELEFAMGVPEPALAPLRFSVFACEAGRCDEIFAETVDPGAAAGRGWRDRRVPLDALAGRTVSLRFETAPPVAGGPPAPSGLWANPTLTARRPRPRGAHNVLLISIDTLRADRLPSYGYPLETAPFLDAAFGREGTVMESLMAAATTTGPAHMTIFTSLSPSAHGVRRRGDALPATAITLAEALRRRGYETGAVTENGALDVARGFGRGFNAYRERKKRRVGVPMGHIDETLAAAREWLARHGDEPFFLFVHSYQVHYPYTPPAAYRELFREPAPGFEPHPGLPPDRDPAHYDREIRYVDDQLRRFFHHLEREGLDRHTMVILTSDHGEEFLEHGFAGHGPGLHREVLHVPLMFRGPGIPRGRRVARPVGHADLMPTILELVGAPAVPSAEGRSFAAALLGGDGEAAPPVLAESWHSNSARLGAPGVAVRVGPRKLIRVPRGESFSRRLYHLGRDPREREDALASEPAQARRLEALLDAHLERAAATHAALRRTAGGRASAPPPDADRAATLRALGYLEGAGDRLEPRARDTCLGER